jgi:hypothetical protein
MGDFSNLLVILERGHARCPGHIFITKTSRKDPARDEHLSVLCRSVNDEGKKFYKFDPRKDKLPPQV